MLKNFLKSLFSFVFELVKIVVISLVIIIPIRKYIIQPFYVKGASMEPNFYDHEYLIINEISYRFDKPQRGDIIVFRYIRNPQEFFIKRVIGLPNERVEIKDGGVYIYNEENSNGVRLNEPYLPKDTKTFALNLDTFTLKEDEFFVLGDNRFSSKDSRSFGPVKKSFIIGKVLVRGWPFTRMNYFEGEKYNF